MILTEEDIERRVELMMNLLDSLKLNGDIQGKYYDLAVKDLYSWAEHAYDGIKLWGWYY